MYGIDVEETVPIWRYNEDGTVKNIRPSIYHRQAVEDVEKHGPRGRIGLIVRNRYGDQNPMTFKQARRMNDLFEKGLLEVVDYLTVNHVPPEYALLGYDTECENAGLNQLY